MMTVRELSKRTGISVRTLHYYDEIGLLPPTAKTEAGYRLYDDKALETLQQILFFREFELPLAQIRAVLTSPALDRSRILQMQRKMLVTKRERLGRLIASIDDILKGEQTMDFTIFSKTELEEMFEEMYARMPERLRQIATGEFGGREKWKEHYVNTLSTEKVQSAYAKVVEWYGGKDRYRAGMQVAAGEVAKSYGKRMNAVLQKLFSRRDQGVDSFAVKECVAEYGFVMKQLYQLEDEAPLMRSLPGHYRDPQQKSRLDVAYGEGSAEFLAQAIEAFYP